MAYVALEDHPEHGVRRFGAVSGAFELTPPAPESWILCCVWRQLLQASALAPHRVLTVACHRLIKRSRTRGECAVEDECGRSLRIAGGEEDRERTTGVVPEDRGFLGSHRVDHQADVVHPAFE